MCTLHGHARALLSDRHMQRQQLQPFAVHCRRATGGSPGGCWRTGAAKSQRRGQTCARQRLCCCRGRQGARSRRAAAACSSAAARGSSSAGRAAAEAAARCARTQLTTAQHARMLAEQMPRLGLAHKSRCCLAFCAVSAALFALAAGVGFLRSATVASSQPRWCRGFAPKRDAWTRLGLHRL